MCENDYLRIGIAERVTRVLTQLRDAGAPRDVAVAYVALSDGETNFIWNIERPLPEDAACCGQIIGLEGVAFHRYVSQDSDVMDWLRTRGWINWNQEEQEIEPAGGLDNPMRPERAALFFEYLAANGKFEVMETLSIGPTQLWLGNGTTCGMPSGVDDVWAFYSETNPWRLITRHLRYLLPSRYDPAGCLSNGFLLPDGSQQRGVAWLTHHAGNPNLALQVYNGNPARWPNRRAYKDSWNYVNNVATTIY